MGTAGYDRAGGVDAELKRVYSDQAIEDQINLEAVTYSKLGTSSKKDMGAGFYGPIKTAGNERGQGAINELEALPTAGKQIVKQYKVDSKIIVHVCRFSGLSMAVSEGNDEAFLDVLTLGMEGAMEDVPKMLNQMVFRGNAWLGVVNGAVTADTTVTFDNAVRTHIRVGMYLDFYASDGTTLEASDIEVTAVDYENLQFTTASDVTLSDNGYICRHNEKSNETLSPDGVMKALNGIPQIVDDGTTYSTYEGIARTGASLVSAWKGITVAAGGVDFSDDLAQRVMMRMHMERGGDTTTRAVTSLFQRRKYLTLTAPTVSVNTSGSATARDSGSKEQLTWNGMPIDFDSDCPEGTWYFYSPKYIQKFIKKAPSFEDKFSGTVLKWDSGYDGAVAFMKTYQNIGTNCCKATGALTGCATGDY
jgi:hypothetical protein